MEEHLEILPAVVAEEWRSGARERLEVLPAVVAAERGNVSRSCPLRWPRSGGAEWGNVSRSRIHTPREAPTPSTTRTLRQDSEHGAVHDSHMPWTYILRCGDGSYYVGSTRDLERRMTEHYAGKGSTYTSRHMPVELVWYFEALDVGTAWALERKIHGWSRPKREALIAGRFDVLPYLARRRTSSADD